MPGSPRCDESPQRRSTTFRTSAANCSPHGGPRHTRRHSATRIHSSRCAFRRIVRTELLVERALPSIVRQTYQNFEVIVVGDGCTNDVAERIEDFGDPRVRFVNLPYRYPYPEDREHRWSVAGAPGVNVGTELARGTWLAMLGDDDELEPAPPGVSPRARPLDPLGNGLRRPPRAPPSPRGGRNPVPLPAGAWVVQLPGGDLHGGAPLLRVQHQVLAPR